jgi:hypothetical protein
MVSFNFQPMFEELIVHGTKVQTIRKRQRAKHGDRLQLYVGMRTKDCRMIAESVCVASSYCAIKKDGVTLGDRTKFPRDLDEFAIADGFKSWRHMLDWFGKIYGQGEFIGHVHKWGELLPRKGSDGRV